MKQRRSLSIRIRTRLVSFINLVMIMVDVIVGDDDDVNYVVDDDVCNRSCL